ncbi:uncharacterized protein LOC115880983 [Sitophilus oryzae]|uniref:Uncharacterized protein LOC115880983 n=1 Tax=Sitophilus oryzae TaxID=7048 RepID=A0A6J2XRQ5_SITOR|nr:uncharacterized protein LOC115880983 [Sitophilus oryzae]
MAIKALILAKAALILSLIVLITKLKSNKEQELIGTYWSVPTTGFSAGGHQPMRAAAQASNVYPEVLYPPTGNSNVMMNPMFPHGPGVQAVHSMRSLQSSEQ